MTTKEEEMVENSLAEAVAIDIMLVSHGYKVTKDMFLCLVCLCVLSNGINQVDIAIADMVKSRRREGGDL